MFATLIVKVKLIIKVKSILLQELLSLK